MSDEKLATYKGKVLAVKDSGTFDKIAITDMSPNYRNFFYNEATAFELMAHLDVSKLRDFTEFYAGSSATRLPDINANWGTTFTAFCQDCKNLVEAPMLSGVIFTPYTFAHAYDYCLKLEKVPLYYTNSTTDMQYMFNYCKSLKEIPLYNTKQVKDVTNMFCCCESLVEIPALDFHNVKVFDRAFSGCSSLTAIHVKKWPYRTTIDLSDTALKRDALMEVFSNANVASRPSGGVINLKLAASQLALLSDEDVSYAEDLGWVLISK